MVEEGRLRPKVLGIHMIQVCEAVVERGKLILVTDGISPADVRAVGLEYAPTPQEALAMAFEQLGPDAKVLVLRGAAEMLPVLQTSE